MMPGGFSGTGHRPPVATRLPPTRAGAAALSARDLVEQTGRSFAEFSAPALDGLQRLPAIASDAVFAVGGTARATLLRHGEALETGTAALLGTAEVAAMVACIVRWVWPCYQVAVLAGISIASPDGRIGPRQQKAAEWIATGFVLLLIILLRRVVFGARDVAQIGRDRVAWLTEEDPLDESEHIALVLALLS